ncbi:MAG TPA: PepSY domain-containing protein [Gemmatimonadaceae bacterium]
MTSSTLRALAVAGATLALAGYAGAQSPTSTSAPPPRRAAATQDTTHRGARTSRAATGTMSRKPKTVKVKEASAGLAAQATIGADSAQAIALAQVPNGRVREAELENEQGTLVYSYDIKVRGKSGVEEVLVDAKTGAVVSTKHESAAAERKEMAGEKSSGTSRGKGAKSRSMKGASDSASKKPSTNPSGGYTTKP